MTLSFYSGQESAPCRCPIPSLLPWFLRMGSQNQLSLHLLPPGVLGLCCFWHICSSLSSHARLTTEQAQRCVVAQAHNPSTQEASLSCSARPCHQTSRQSKQGIYLYFLKTVFISIRIQICCITCAISSLADGMLTDTTPDPPENRNSVSHSLSSLPGP